MSSQPYFFFVPRNEPKIDGSHVAPVIQILAWLLLTFSILSVAAQFLTKIAISRPFGVSDALLFAALVFYIGQTSTLLSPAGQVIGNSPVELPMETIHGALKALYSIEILSIFSFVFVKSSVFAALWSITPVVWHRIVIYIASAVTVAWGTTSVFAVAFQCPSPQRWNVVDPTCIDIRAVKIYIAVMNILTDLALVILPTIIILPIQMPWGTRITILSAFWLRLTVVVASVIQVAYTRRLLINDLFLNNIWQTTVCQMVVQSTGIMAACIPFLKPFLMSLESGFLRADDVNRRTTAGMYGSEHNLKTSGRATSYIKMKNQSWQSRESSAKVGRSVEREENGGK
ncbi:uncharacterized protein EAE97_002841 [Botrytis byssoidea]|uniref:Rhodopsin domain-containing protein n=1 Tax=Botrytis byssoidea TaxID=139641 RepID=A0A9P5IUC3_9HELO|nr:uncharacterized protein EAE97_002841 [Botrytis byssoidea]KAF7949332.1 hypothetical protein EAE97_002841 [Botrytis byssoidea]